MLECKCALRCEIGCLPALEVIYEDYKPAIPQFAIESMLNASLSLAANERVTSSDDNLPRNIPVVRFIRHGCKWPEFSLRVPAQRVRPAQRQGARTSTIRLLLQCSRICHRHGWMVIRDNRRIVGCGPSGFQCCSHAGKRPLRSNSSLIRFAQAIIMRRYKLLRVLLNHIHRFS